MNKIFCGLLLCGLVSLVGCKGFEECGKALTQAECDKADNFEASAGKCQWDPSANNNQGGCVKVSGSGAKGSGANQ